jgi:ABC-type transport system substrate-binding protein
MERAAFLASWREKRLKGVMMVVSGGSGNAATRLEPYGVSTGAYAYGGHPDLDALFRQQALERDRAKREALLHQLQRLMQEQVMHAPLAEPAALHGVGPRVEEPGVGLIPLFAYFGPYEEMRLKKP